ncbi:phage major capsid protein, P2 family [Serratia ficaria]|nr:phage major capsid protein, P2 family [Serratia ficaria]
MNFDFHLRYKTLDLWARYQDFQLRIRNAIVKRQALDFIMAGFNGISRAPTSDRSKNPMLQDVAIGWLQKYRNEAPTRVMSKITGDDGAVISEVIRIGKGGDYANLDAVVMDATNNLIAPWHQESPDLVVICGRKLLADKYFPLVNQDQPNTEAMAADVIVSQKRIGNLPAVRVPYFPANAMFVTSLENLSIYFMDESHRRHIEENAKRDRVENYESMNIDYVVEDYGFGCLIENIEMGDFSKPATASQPQEAAATDSAEQPQETAATDSGE